MTSARKATTKAIAANARNRMPLENASRSPRVCNCRGRKRSWARIDPSTGNPLNAVLAASTRISAVTTGDQVETDREAVEHRVGRSARSGSSGGSPPGAPTSWSCGRSAICTPVSLASMMMPMNSVTDDDAQQQQRRRRVARLGFPEGRHPVADRLDTGQRRTAGRERPRDQEHQREPEDVAVFGMHLEIGRLGAQRRRRARRSGRIPSRA